MDSQRFDDYIMNRLDATERQVFESELDTNEVFKQAYLEHLEIVKSIEYLAFDQLKVQLKKTHKENISKRPNWIKYLAVVLIGVAVAFSFYYFMHREKELIKSDSPQLFAQYYEDFELPGNLRNETSDSLRNLFNGLYQAKDYGALIVFSEASQDLFSEPSEKIAIACSYLQSNNFELADQLFIEVSKAGDPAYRYSADWYYALSLVKQNRISDAIDILEKLSDAPSYYASKAKELLKQF